jgi:hypothetical protein
VITPRRRRIYNNDRCNNNMIIVEMQVTSFLAF